MTDTVADAEENINAVEGKENPESLLNDKTEEISKEQNKDVSDEKEQVVPLKALQKERQKRQEIEYEYKYFKEQLEKEKASNQVDEDEYEPVTKADFNKQLKAKELEIIRSVQESEWRRNNPDKAAIVDEKLEEFLKHRPHYINVLNTVANRYSEAWDLMAALMPSAVKKNGKEAAKPSNNQLQAPNAPGSIPKAAGINQAVDLMQMTDKEFAEWRAAKRRRR